jgi:chromosome segregation ATPase
MLESASKTAGAANAVVEQASAWSTRNAEQLAQLLDRHQSHLDRISDLRATLDTVLGRFKEALGQYTTVTADLRQITSQVSTLAAAAAGTTQTMQNTQAAVERVTNSMASQVVQLAQANQAQADTWKQIQASMQQYEQTFHRVEQNAGALLTQIGQHLRDYTQITQKGYEDLGKMADEHFKTAVERLGSSINELDEYLQDLTETFAKAQRSGGTDGRRG